MLRGGVLLLDPHTRGEDGRQQVRKLAAAHFAAQSLQRVFPGLCNMLLYRGNILWQRANAHHYAIIHGFMPWLAGWSGLRQLARLFGFDVRQLFVSGLDDGRQSLLWFQMVRTIHEEQRIRSSL